MLPKNASLAERIERLFEILAKGTLARRRQEGQGQ